MVNLINEYPPVGFYFKVQINGFPDSESDFQEVSGLSVSLETQAVKEGGENRFTHQLPLPAKSEPLLLKRGLKVESSLIDWCKKALEEFSFSPKNLHLFLLDVEAGAESKPLAAWHIIHAYPTKWEVSGFNSMNNELAIETIQLQYNYFKKSF